jgi:biopolymer transport protein ExbB
MKRFGLMKLVAVSLTALVLSLSGGISDAHAWWDAKWQFRKKISFDTTDKGAAIKDNVTDVPVLLRLHAGNFVFDNAKPDGSDIRVVASDDKMPLKFHIESFDTKKQIALVWVRVPQLAGAAASDAVWLYYGNSSVAAGQDAGGTYDTGQALVLHLNEADGTPKDSTGYSNHASEFTGKLGTAAIIGGGATFPGNGSKLVVKRAPSLKFDKGFTFSAWVNPAQAQADARLFSWEERGQGIVVGINGGRVFARVGAAQVSAGADIAPKAWHQVAVTAEPGKRLTIYLDGKEAGTASMATSIPSPAAELAFGAALDGKNSFFGDMDEVQLASLVRPAAWLSATFNSQGQDGKLMTYGQEESGKGGGENLTVHLMKVIAKSVTFDGWMVIGLCTSMLLLATYVFIRKFIALQNLIRANKEFSEAFDNIVDPLELDAESDEHEDSSIFRIYRAGYKEIARWTNKQDPDSSKGMSRAAISIFETALDRASVREVQELNSWMIVLTLGISGGPFWGLLGTVWGVMNTFGSLAEAGEANLSAIAPGVASALACTLFGLLVAIPSLFAYSYLITRMKKVNQDVRLFIDEFTGKVEEAYGDEA